MSDDHVEIHVARSTMVGVSILALSLALLPVMVLYSIDPPRGAYFGQTGLIARVVGLMGLVAVPLLIVSIVRSLVLRGRELVMDHRGFWANTWLRTYRVVWDDVQKLRYGKSEGGLLLVFLCSGKQIKLRTKGYEDPWNRGRVAREMRRLSGGRVELPF